MNNKTVKKLNRMAALFLIFGIFCGGFVFGMEVNRVRDKRLNAMIQAYNYLLNDWYEGVELDEAINEYLLRDFVNAIVDDANTIYTSTISDVGYNYRAGFGITYTYYSRFPRLTRIEPFGPFGKAEVNGVKIEVNDFILAVNDTSVEDLPGNRASGSKFDALLKSTTDPNEIDSFVIAKPDASGNPDLTRTTKYVIKAGWYEVETVYSKLLNPETALLTITQFELATPGKVATLLKSYQDSGVKNLLLDLRGNPGGFITSINEIADLLLPNKATIAIYEYKDGSKTITKASNNHHYQFESMFVMTDRGSASASEMLTGALIDNHLATQVGTTTYGKGSAQKTVRLGVDGGQLSYTYAVWTTVGRERIHKVGISPEREETPTGLHLVSLPNYQTSYNESELAQINNFLGEIASSNPALYQAAKAQIDAHLHYDFDTYILLNNLRIESYLGASNQLVNACLERLYGV